MSAWQLLESSSYIPGKLQSFEMIYHDSNSGFFYRLDKVLILEVN
jgi:hypothetical protein